MFIDKNSYDSLMSRKDISQEEVVQNIYKAVYIADKHEDVGISELTYGFIVTINRLLKYVVFDDSTLNYDMKGIMKGISKDNKNYIEHSLTTLLSSKIDAERYYEVILTNTSKYGIIVLVVVREGFITSMIESKDNLEKLLLDILNQQYDNSCDLYYTMKTYLTNRKDQTYHNLVSVRYNTPVW